MAELIIVLICLLINALFACFEMGFVSVSKADLARLAKEGRRAASDLLVLRKNPERTLSVVQIGITLVGIISAAAGGAGAEENLAPYFEGNFGLSEDLSEILAIVLVVIPLTLTNVVFGELIPKAIALKSPLFVVLTGVRAIGLVDRVFSPLVYLLEVITKFFLRFVPSSRSSGSVDHVASVDIDHLSRQTQQYVLNLVGIEQRRVQDIMIPWDKVDVVSSSAERDEVVQLSIRSGHTRLPVVNEGIVVGILHTKEFIATITSGIDDWKAIIRANIEVSPLMTALQALRRMQDQKTHMAIVTVHGTPVGVVTVEDIFEEIVGEFYDEDDDGKVKRLLMARGQLRSRH